MPRLTSYTPPPPPPPKRKNCDFVRLFHFSVKLGDGLSLSNRASSICCLQSLLYQGICFVQWERVEIHPCIYPYDDWPPHLLPWTSVSVTSGAGSRVNRVSGTNGTSVINCIPGLSPYARPLNRQYHVPLSAIHVITFHVQTVAFADTVQTFLFRIKRQNCKYGWIKGLDERKRNNMLIFLFSIEAKAPRGVLPEKFDGVCVITKFCVFCYPFYDLANNSIPHLWPLQLAQLPLT